MALKPWYTVVTPREDLRDGKPLDASEFAVHLDKVRDGTAPPVYADPAKFFERTFLTQTLTTLGGDVIRRMLPADQPFLILMDELMNYVTRNRRSGLSAQLYAFMHNLSETVRGMARGVLAVSIPASELEMSAEDQADYDRFKKLLDR